LRIQSFRASPTLSRQLIALAEQYELRIKDLSPSIRPEKIGEQLS
jgi:hypothetical protein